MRPRRRNGPGGRIILRVAGQRGRSSVTVRELLVRGQLRAGERLVGTHRGNRHAAEVLPDGRIRVADGQSFSSPSYAARHVTGHNTNGWRFWTVDRGGRAEELASLRARGP
jgi:hypothetical protein